MRQISFVLSFVTILAIGCKKKDKTHFSTWTVNGEQFTAHADGAIGKAVSLISGRANTTSQNEFNVIFFTLGLPTSGDWALSDGTKPNMNPNYAHLNFVYNGKFYIHPDNYDDIITASLDADGIKAHYSLPLAWFVNYYNYSDSIQISGEFYEPYQNTNE